MLSKTTKKLCIVVSSLADGGAEKSSAVLSTLLYNLGYEVHVISVLNTIDYAYKGTLFNLGVLKDKDDSFFGKLKRFLVFFNYLRLHKFDFIIDSRSRPSVIKQFIINKVLYANEKVIFIIHSFFLNEYIPTNKHLAKYLYNNTYKFVTVSNAIKKTLVKRYYFQDVNVIYNAFVEDLTTSTSEHLLPSEKFMLFFGRVVDDVKNLSLLIESYKLSGLADKKVKLVILGDGKDKTKLEQKVRNFNLSEQILFLPYIKNPYPVVSKAMCVVLTSKYEGLPTMLIESLSLGTPVISVNCESGPAEIIQNGFNGLLVENYKPDLFAEAMNRFVNNKELYTFCERNAMQSVQKFSMENISRDWKKILE
jgi:glycosyltransferase involved in cell wall biosynthesis|tara:strand:- start:1857 stop:2948 length:1092 start_codon:yes stop_codon:yes gene_type:complete